MKPDKSKTNKLKTNKPNNPVAIIGMGCLFPRSASLKNYWRLIFNGIDGITDIPNTHWSPDDYFDNDPKKPDHTYCKRGGFLPKVPFDPMEFGIPPSVLEATDTSQLLGLVVAKMALENSGYGNGIDFNRENTSVILGVTGTQEIVIPLGARLGFPKWRTALKNSGISETKSEEIINRISDSYISWQENSFPGLLGNVVAGRICNRLDLGGTNCVVDAACASSMGAVNLAVMELMSGRSDMVITGGVDTLNDIFMHICFSKTMTLSSTGDAKPFSRHADGTVLGEGVGMLVLKRLEDAEKDNNRIYAVIKSIGSSSDGRSQSIYAPRSKGQVKALTRAYELAEIKPASIELIEAHGTGTRVGDAVEFKSISSIFSASSGNGYKCALGSVKSMIGHTKAASGAAGIIKAAMAIYSKVLPPTLKADEPDPDLDFDSTPFYLNKCKRPWLPKKNHPRRSGVSAFGFGGSNFHLVLEEYKKEKDVVTWDGSVDILALSAASIKKLIDLLDDFKNSFDKESTPADIMIKTAASRDSFSEKPYHRLLIVLEWPIDSDAYLSMLFKRIGIAKAQLQSGIKNDSWNFKNIFYGSGKKKGGTGFLFPGQGSQYPGMGIDIVCTFPGAIDALDSADKAFDGKERISDFIYPFNSTNDYKEKEYGKILAKTDIAQPAIGAVSLAMLRALQYFGLKPDAAAGHSFGELTALMAAGWIDVKTFFFLAAARGALMAKAGETKGKDGGAMLAVQAPLEELEALIKDNPDLVLANKNSINQGVLSGTTAAIDDIKKISQKKGYRAVKLDVSNAFHSALVADAVEPFLEIVNNINIKSGEIPVYSNTTALPYPADSKKAKKILGRHPGLPIDFISNIRNMYNDGIRNFIEIGPKAVLTGLVKSILKGRDINAVAVDISCGKKSGIADLACVLCNLASSGIELELRKWEHISTLPKKHLMNIPLTGANYIEHKNQNYKNSSKNNKGTVPNAAQQTSEIDTTLNRFKVDMPPATAGSKGGSIVKQNITNNITTNSNDNSMVKNGAIPEALLVVQEGLKAMQVLQLKTAETHEKFLETQAEASRTLQKMMESTSHIAEVSAGVSSVNLIKIKENQENNQKKYQENKQAVITPAPVTQQEENLDDQKPAKPLKDLEIEKHLLAVVTELTGYPSEMLGMDMDIESDLGIDSIKRVEIFSTLEEKLPDLPAVSPEDMAGLKTLGQIVDYLSQKETLPVKNKNLKQDLKKDRQPFEISETSTLVETGLKPVSTGFCIEFDEIKSHLLGVVTELTGYPSEMLGMDMDIESDLGIDSIKRVEIFSTLEEKLPDLPAVSPEDMAGLKTLGQIVDYLTQGAQPDGQPKDSDDPNDLPPNNSRRDKKGNTPDNNVEKRVVSSNVVSIVEQSLAKTINISIPNGKKIYITNSGTGLAESIADEFAHHGIATAIISKKNCPKVSELESAGGLLLLHDEGMNGENELSVQDSGFLKDDFLLLKNFAQGLLNSASEGGALFASITSMDGAFGFKGDTIFNPFYGGLAGIVKTAALEWEGVNCHAIDMAPALINSKNTAKKIVLELLNDSRSSSVEIGIGAEAGVSLKLEPSIYDSEGYNLSYNSSGEPKPDINDNDVILITGGAKGITAACAIALTEHARPALVLLGRSPEPEQEPAWLASLTTEADIKKAILKNEQAFALNKKEFLTPSQLEKKYRKYVSNREIFDNLEQLKKRGVRVSYYSVDIRSRKAVKAVYTKVRSVYGPVTGIIHGAGVLEDRLIIDKTPEQFEKVFDTKVKGFKTLLEVIGDNDLKFIVIFSSIAARTGNIGQVDYAAANEVLNKLAQQESIARPGCRIVSINWGPWDGGMVTESLKKEFNNRGIALIPVDKGADFMIRELSLEPGSPVEVVIGANITSKADNLPDTAEELSLSFKQEVDIQKFPVLQSHMLAGKAVVPFALMAEWFGHGALHANPGLLLHGLDNMRLLNGIKLENDTKIIRLMAGSVKKNGTMFELNVELKNGIRENGKDLVHSRARAVLTSGYVKPPDYIKTKENDNKPYTKTIDDVYEQVLFHGDKLHGLKNIVSLSSSGIVAEVASAPSPADWITEPLRSRWIADPLVLDSAFQMATLWCYEEKGVVSLPSYAASYRQYRKKFPSNGITVILQVKDVTIHKMTGNFIFLDSKEEIIATLTGYESVMDASLYKSFKPEYTL